MLADLNALATHFTSDTIAPGAVHAQLGPRIRAARHQWLPGQSLEGFGQQVAELIGRERPFSNVTVSNWETGRQEPSFTVLVGIARLTKLPLRYFAGVGEIDDYPRIDWFATEQAGPASNVERLALSMLSLPQRRRQLVISQLRSLVQDLQG